jgi:hypothetical protein
MYIDTTSAIEKPVKKVTIEMLAVITDPSKRRGPVVFATDQDWDSVSSGEWVYS